MDVAVVIPLFNGAKWISQTLQSVFSQSMRPVEVVVVDDGSGDESREIVQVFSEVTLLENPSKGVHLARNFGLKHTKAPLVTFLDQDDLWHPDHLRILSDILEQNDKCPAAVASTCHFDSDDSLVFPSPVLDAQLFDPWNNFPINEIYTPSAVVIRRTVLNAVGDWPTQFVAAADYYTWLRLSSHEPLLQNRNVTVGYRLHHQSFSVGLRSQASQKYFNAMVAASENALAHRLAVCSHNAEVLKRRLTALISMSAILTAMLNSDRMLLTESVHAFEESVHAESTSFIYSLGAILFWFMLPNTSWETLEWQHNILNVLLENWPRDARTTRKILLSRLKTTLSTRIFLKYLQSRPYQVQRWILLVDVIRKSSLNYLISKAI